MSDRPDNAPELGIGLSTRDENLDEFGREILDPTPIAPPVGYKRQPSMVERIRQMVRDERLAQELADSGVESFEEADDFDVGDDFDPKSPYEEVFEPPVPSPSASPSPAPAAPAGPPTEASETPTPSPAAPAAASV